MITTTSSPDRSNNTSIAGPKLSTSEVDMAPERGFVKSIWSKVVDVYTSTFKADDRIDALQKMPAHELQIANAITAWADYSDRVDSTIRLSIKTVSTTVGCMVANSANGFGNAMTKLNHAYLNITGYTASELTAPRRQELSMTQRAQLSRVYDQFKDELVSSKMAYNTGAQTINEVSNAMTSLVQVDQEIQNALNITNQVEAWSVHHMPPMLSTVQGIDLLGPAIQAVAPGAEQKLGALYVAERDSIFAALANSEGVNTNDPTKMKDAILTAATGLHRALNTVTYVAAHAAEIAAYIKSTREMRDELLRSPVPGDTMKPLAYVSQVTVTTLKNWFNSKTKTAALDLSCAFNAAQTKSDLYAWCSQAHTFGLATEQYRATLKNLQAIGSALPCHK